jgi:hypothetical protein
MRVCFFFFFVFTALDLALLAGKSEAALTLATTYAKMCMYNTRNFDKVRTRTTAHGHAHAPPHTHTRIDLRDLKALCSKTHQAFELCAKFPTLYANLYLLGVEQALWEEANDKPEQEQPEAEAAASPPTPSLPSFIHIFFPSGTALLYHCACGGACAVVRVRVPNINCRRTQRADSWRG